MTDPGLPEPHWAGYFISFEGVDGAGKSTQVAALAMALRGEGHNVVTVREPGDTNLGELTRAYVLQHQERPLSAWAEALLFVAARVQLLNDVILPALLSGDVVITDRYADSTLAYQGGGRGLDLGALRRLHRDACGDVWPDLTVLLDLPPAAAVSRRRAGELPFDRMERAPEEFHAAVHATFRDLARASAKRIVLVDASGPAISVSQRVWEVVAERIADIDGRVTA
ncbi:MAG TPA: dTMP kinase [Candidatus Dormibacteraeota bacterium]|jgi:dTMP kinase|nr:dTMP kinase [Candidatus Dormibacteraeota bacterium]